MKLLEMMKKKREEKTLKKTVRHRLTHTHTHVYMYIKPNTHMNAAMFGSEEDERKKFGDVPIVMSTDYYYAYYYYDYNNHHTAHGSVNLKEVHTTHHHTSIHGTNKLDRETIVSISL